MKLNVLFGAVIGASLLAGGASAEPVTIKVATFVPEQSVGVSKVIKPWMEAVQAEAGDKVNMQAFWGGSLGKDPFKQYELVKNGVADVTWVLPGYTAGQFPELQIMELPFFAETAREASIAGWDLYQQGLLNGFEDTHLIGHFASEPNSIFTKGAITSLDDLKNKKMRSVGPLHAEWATAIGASPETIASTKMNEAFNRGILDAAIQGWTGMQTFKTIKLVDHVHEVPIGVIPFLLLMNKTTWEKLPADVQAIFMKHGGLAMANAGGQAYADIGESIRQEVLKEGRVTFVPVTPELDKKYRADAAPIHKSWIAATPNGQTVYDAMMKSIAATRGKS
ncbi:MAG: TRAP transporter substrate-binding protein [Rhodospirillales bacterium]